MVDRMKAVLALMLIFVLIACSEARLPKVGDSVEINTQDRCYFGNITDMDQHFVCLNADELLIRNPGDILYEKMNLTTNFDICFGYDEIKTLLYHKYADWI